MKYQIILAHNTASQRLDVCSKLLALDVDFSVSNTRSITPAAITVKLTDNLVIERELVKLVATTPHSLITNGCVLVSNGQIIE